MDKFSIPRYLKKNLFSNFSSAFQPTHLPDETLLTSFQAPIYQNKGLRFPNILLFFLKKT